MSRRIREHPRTRPADAADLRGIALFDGLDEAVLPWLAERGQVVELEEGEIFTEPGEPADEMFVVLDGHTEFEFPLGGQDVAYRTYEVGDVTGVLPYSRMTHHAGRGCARQPTRIFWIGREHLTDLVRASPELGGRLVALMADRVRDSTRASEQRDRMASLGKLSAGLAHELNNPASAVRRSAAALRDRLAALPDLVARLVANGVSHDALAAAEQICALARPDTGQRLGTLERSEQEDALADWLERHGVADAWVRAETLVDAGLGSADLEETGRDIPASAVPDLIAWAESRIAADRLLAEIAASADRITELIAAVKAYSHMDRAHDRQPVDLRAGIDATLTMLGHKLRAKAVNVERDLPDDLPAITGFPGQLNQVWTNLIDNALDALIDGGTLRITAERTESHVDVCIADDGHGIPETLRSRIFEPFFTTKDVDQGTGLGLDIVRRIVTQAHGGTIDVASRPGHTVFTVRLPIAGPD